MARIATGTSQSGPQNNQTNRSGPNFNFVAVPPRGTNISVAMPPGITCAMLWDRPARADKIIVENLQNGSSFRADGIEKGNDYYLANPTGASGDFFVDFNGVG